MKTLVVGVLAMASAMTMFGAVPSAGAPTQGMVKDWVTKSVFVIGCEEPKYDFSAVQIGKPVKRYVEYAQKQMPLYPVHVNYAMNCTYSDEEMHVEVDLTYSLYRDTFGNWKNFGPDFDDDQKWSDASNTVRCRAQAVARLQMDANRKVIGKTPAQDTTYQGCIVKLSGE